MVTTLATLTLAEWTGILFDCVLFELSGKYASDNNECNIANISNALLVAWRIHERFPHLFTCPFDNSISKTDLILANIKQYINTTRRYTYSIFSRQLSVGTRHVPCRINKQGGASIKEFVSLPVLSPLDTQVFLDRYAALVPSQYHDDFSILVLHLRDTWWKHKGSGGLNCFLSNGMEGVTKLSRRHNDKKRDRPTNARFPPGELERLRLAARKLEFDAKEQQCQALVRLETFRDEQQEKRQQDTLRIRQERLEAERLEAERLEVERLEAERLEVERLELEQLETERMHIQRLSKERKKKEIKQTRELKRLQTLIKELEEKRPQDEDELLIIQERLVAIRLEEQGILAEQQEKKDRDQRVETIESYLKKLHPSVACPNTKYKEANALRQMLQEKLRQYTDTSTITVHLFGSFESGLCCINSDADFTVNNFVQPFHGRNPIEELAKALRWAECQSVTTITNARVPIVKFTAQGFKCDMSMEQPMGVLNSKLISTYRRIDKRFLTLWFAIKRIASRHEILSGSDGYLSSYSLALMLIVFLQDVTSPAILSRLQQQHRSRIEEHNINGYDCSFDHDWRRYRASAQINTKRSAQLLIDFCQFYGYTFDYATQEVNPCLGVIKARSYEPPPRSEWDQRPKDWSLCVLDPFVVGRNVAGNCCSNNVAEIQQCFRAAFDALSAGDVQAAFKLKKPFKAPIN
ncbi:hypothetical protein BGZ91_012404 [Linnemannia elongata]|nr:hypothetical protein BGZ91_012404 [Linnemannia elongata]